MDTYIQTNALLVYALVMIAAALLHWGQKVRKGEATPDFVDYWIAETPGYSLGTLGALGGAIWLVHTTDGLAGMASHMIVASAFASGWMIDSAVAAGSTTVAAKAAHKAAGFVRLDVLPWLMLLSLCAFLAGCPSMTEPLHTKPSTEAPAVEAARTVIDETNAALIALDRAIDANIDDKIWDKPQAQAVFDESKALGKRLDQAREALRLGDPLDAKTQAEAVKFAILALHRKVAAQARKESK